MAALTEALAPLTSEHRAALEWFLARRGDLIPWPETLDGLFLVNRPKGIHKPKNWTHTLSVRQALKGPYPDRAPVGSVEHGWRYDYFQEGSGPEDLDRLAGNRGLAACMRDGVPVAVLIQEQPRPKVRYRVWGLAKVVGYDEGYFHLAGYDWSGEMPDAAPEGVGGQFLTSPTILASAAEPGIPFSTEDARKRIDAQIVARQGGKAFRDRALKDFNQRCAISGCEVRAVLEAAHIVPYLGQQTNTADNSLLLRSDLHTLFDRGLLWIDPDSLRIQTSAELEGTPYADFTGQEVARPTSVTTATLRDRLIARRDVLTEKL